VARPRLVATGNTDPEAKCDQLLSRGSIGRFRGDHHTPDRAGYETQRHPVLLIRSDLIPDLFLMHKISEAPQKHSEPVLDALQTQRPDALANANETDMTFE
jgi:hypothetical protein